MGYGYPQNPKPLLGSSVALQKCHILVLGSAHACAVVYMKNFMLQLEKSYPELSNKYKLAGKLICRIIRINPSYIKIEYSHIPIPLLNIDLD